MLSGGEVTSRHLYILGHSLLQILSFVIILYSLADSIDSSYAAAKDNIIKIQKKLLMTENPQEKQILEYIMKRIEMLRPMSACGFFEIEKSTLTSMLSVR